MNVLTKHRLLSMTNIGLLVIAVLGLNPDVAYAEEFSDDSIIASSTPTGVAEVIQMDLPGVERVIFYPTENGYDDLISGFGYRVKACDACSSNHHGADFAPGYGEKVRAVSYGKISFIGWEPGLGYVVKIKHNADYGLPGVETLYAHLKANSELVRVGEFVSPEQPIAKVGQTGVATVPHLHFEVHLNGMYLNPVDWLEKYDAKKPN